MKRKIANNFFFVLVFIVTVAFFGLIKDFLLGVFWAIILTIIFGSWYDKILGWVGNRKNLASGITLFVILLMVIIPVILLAVEVVNQAIALADRIQNGGIDIQAYILEIENYLPKELEQYDFDVASVRAKITERLSNSAQTIMERVLGFTQGVFGLLVQMTLCLYMLFFFFRDSKELVKQLIYVLPIGDDKEIQLLNRFQSVARATVKGSLLIAMIQGVLGGILFLSLGVQGAVLWAVIMVVAALLPVGAVVVWGPIAATFFAQGEYTKGMILVVVGALFIGLIDNLLRPRLVGNDTKMPDYLILLATLGGLTWFGLSGFVLGPIIAALFTTCWQMVGREFGEARNDNNQLESSND